MTPEQQSIYIGFMFIAILIGFLVTIPIFIFDMISNLDCYEKWKEYRKYKRELKYQQKKERLNRKYTAGKTI